MASENNSAVLDLNDVDITEDTDATSITGGPQDGTPLIMEHGYDIAVKVDAPMKQLSTLETFVTYRVQCVCGRWSTPSFVRRRYNHFKVLHKRLVQAYPLIAPPALPPLHSARQQLDRYSPSFVAVRTLALDAFLNRVAKHPILTYSDDFRIFLTTPDEEFEKVFKSENSALNLWGLSSALYGSSESKSANGARVKDPEFTSTVDYLQSLQQKLTTLCVLTNKLYKGSTALGTEMVNMKRVCDPWATQERGRVACAVSAVGSACQSAAGGRQRPVRTHRALLPLLAAYCGAHVDKIRQRDAIHATYVAGNSSDELHNRLEQASEALRSELSDWLPKTHSEIKTLLLDLADKQVNIHTQTLMSWEHALKLSSEPNIEDIFKTVSKTAVQNLSPSKCRPESTTETEKDFDDIDSNDDSDVQDFRNQELDTEATTNDETNFEILMYNEVQRNHSPNTNFEKNPEFSNNDDNINISTGKTDSASNELSLASEELLLNSRDVNLSNTEEANSEVPFTPKEKKLNTTSDQFQNFSEVDLSS